MKNGHNKWQQQGMYNCIYLCTATKVYARKSVRRRLASRLKRLGGKAVACRLASPYRFKNIGAHNTHRFRLLYSVIPYILFGGLYCMVLEYILEGFMLIFYISRGRVIGRCWRSVSITFHTSKAIVTLKSFMPMSSTSFDVYLISGAYCN